MRKMQRRLQLKNSISKAASIKDPDDMELKGCKANSFVPEKDGRSWIRRPKEPRRSMEARKGMAQEKRDKAAQFGRR